MTTSTDNKNTSGLGLCALIDKHETELTPKQKIDIALKRNDMGKAISLLRSSTVFSLGYVKEWYQKGLIDRDTARDILATTPKNILGNRCRVYNPQETHHNTTYQDLFLQYLITGEFNQIHDESNNRRPSNLNLTSTTLNGVRTSWLKYQRSLSKNECNTGSQVEDNERTIPSNSAVSPEQSLLSLLNEKEITFVYQQFVESSLKELYASLNYRSDFSSPKWDFTSEPFPIFCGSNILYECNVLSSVSSIDNAILKLETELRENGVEEKPFEFEGAQHYFDKELIQRYKNSIIGLIKKFDRQRSYGFEDYVRFGENAENTFHMPRLLKVILELNYEDNSHKENAFRRIIQRNLLPWDPNKGRFDSVDRKRGCAQLVSNVKGLIQASDYFLEAGIENPKSIIRNEIQRIAIAFIKKPWVVIDRIHQEIFFDNNDPQFKLYFGALSEGLGEDLSLDLDLHNTIIETMKHMPLSYVIRAERFFNFDEHEIARIKFGCYLRAVEYNKKSLSHSIPHADSLSIDGSRDYFSLMKSIDLITENNLPEEEKVRMIEVMLHNGGIFETGGYSELKKIVERKAVPRETLIQMLAKEENMDLILARFKRIDGHAFIGSYNNFVTSFPELKEGLKEGLRDHVECFIYSRSTRSIQYSSNYKSFNREFEGLKREYDFCQAFGMEEDKLREVYVSDFNKRVKVTTLNAGDLQKVVMDAMAYYQLPAEVTNPILEKQLVQNVADKKYDHGRALVLCMSEDTNKEQLMKDISRVQHQ